MVRWVNAVSLLAIPFLLAFFPLYAALRRIAVYFGAVGVQRTRHAVPAGLIADAAGVIASVFVCRLVLGGG